MLQCALPHSTNPSAGILSLAVREAVVALAVFKDARTLSSSAHSRSSALCSLACLLEVQTANVRRRSPAHDRGCATTHAVHAVLAVCHPGVRVLEAQVAGAAAAHASIATCGIFGPWAVRFCHAHNLAVCTAPSSTQTAALSCPCADLTKRVRVTRCKAHLTLASSVCLLFCRR